MKKLINSLATLLVLIFLSSNIVSEAISTNISSILNSQTISNQSKLDVNATQTTNAVNSTKLNNSILNTLAMSSLSNLQNTLIVKLPTGKKQLKKKLSLEYTSPKFESELSDQQKNAILTSLKKWKLDLPINNTFTITSITDIATKENEISTIYNTNAKRDEIVDKSNTSNNKNYKKSLISPNATLQHLVTFTIS